MADKPITTANVKAVIERLRRAMSNPFEINLSKHPFCPSPPSISELEAAAEARGREQAAHVTHELVQCTCRSKCAAGELGNRAEFEQLKAQQEAFEKANKMIRALSPDPSYSLRLVEAERERIRSAVVNLKRYSYNHFQDRGMVETSNLGYLNPADVLAAIDDNKGGE